VGVSNVDKINLLKRKGEYMGYKHIDDELEPYFDLIMDCIKLKGKDIKETVNRIVGDTSAMDECLEDSFLNFKLHAKKVRDEYRKAVEEEISKSEDLYCKYSQLVSDQKPRIEQVKNAVAELNKELSEVYKKLEEIPYYKAEYIMDVITKFNNMPAEEKLLLSKLMEASK
jgi:uncharacterized protein YfbU (UPF0304 family)